MSDPRAERINEAVRECIARCCQQPNPLACVAETMARLRADPAWTEADVREVELAVQRILTRMAGDDDQDILSP